jgi:hypothetical protein
MRHNNGKPKKGNFTPMTKALMVEEKGKKRENRRQQRKDRKGKNSVFYYPRRRKAHARRAEHQRSLKYFVKPNK